MEIPIRRKDKSVTYTLKDFLEKTKQNYEKVSKYGNHIILRLFLMLTKRGFNKEDDLPLRWYGQYGTKYSRVD